jgi:hypothetical protein
VVPSETTIRRALPNVDTGALDDRLAAWLLAQADAGLAGDAVLAVAVDERGADVRERMLAQLQEMIKDSDKLIARSFSYGMRAGLRAAGSPVRPPTRTGPSHGRPARR